MRAAARSGARSGDWVIMSSAVLQGVINYAYSFVMVHLLAPSAFAAFSALSSLLLVVGTFSGASIPMVVAREVVNGSRGSAARRHAVAFALAASGASAAVASVVVLVLSTRYASPALQGLAVLSCFAVFYGTVSAGYLQGERRFRLLTATRLLEVGGKLLIGTAIVLLWPTAEGAIAGFAAGSLLVSAAGIWIMRHDLGGMTWRGVLHGELWGDSVRLGLIQALVSLGQAIDIVVLGLVLGNTLEFAQYQAALILARVPLFVAAALATTAFPQLADRSRSQAEAESVVGQSLERFVLLAAVMTAGIATAPSVYLRLVLPEQYLVAAPLLLPLSLAASAAGVLVLTTTYFKGVSRFRAVAVLQIAVIVVTAGVVALTARSTTAVAWSMAATTGLGALASLVLVRRRWPGAHVPWPAAAAFPVALAALELLRPVPVAWTIAGVMLVAGAVYWLAVPRGRTGPVLPEAGVRHGAVGVRRAGP